LVAQAVSSEAESVKNTSKATTLYMNELRYSYQNVTDSGGRSVINLGGPGHLSPSVNPPFFPSLSWTPRGSGQSPLTRWKTIWCNFCSQSAL